MVRVALLSWWEHSASGKGVAWAGGRQGAAPHGVGWRALSYKTSIQLRKLPHDYY